MSRIGNMQTTGRSRHGPRALWVIAILAPLAGRVCGGEFRISRFRREIRVVNPSDRPRLGAVVAFSCKAMLAVAPGLAGVEVTDGHVSLPTQLDDLDGDRIPDEVVFQVDLDAGEEKKLWLTSLKADERPFKPPKRTHAVETVVHVGYAALESELSAYGIHCSYPRVAPLGALQLQCYGKPADGLGLNLAPAQGLSADGPAEPRPALTALLAIADSFGLGGPAIGRARPRNGETAVVFHRVICSGPLRAGVAVDVMRWRTANAGRYDVRLEYYVYPGQEYVDVRVRVDVQQPASEAMGFGMVAFGAETERHGGMGAGCFGQWGTARQEAGPMGLGIIVLPDDVALAEGFGQTRSRFPGNRIVYLSPRLDAVGSCTWRLILTADWAKGGRVNARTFPRRLIELGRELAQPVWVDDQAPGYSPER